MARNYIEGQATNEAGAAEFYRNVSVIPLGKTNALVVTEAASAALTTRLDEASASVTYVGKGAIGSADSAAVWQIQKITVSGTVTSITWADSNANFDNVWADRASLTYG